MYFILIWSVQNKFINHLIIVLNSDNEGSLFNIIDQNVLFVDHNFQDLFKGLNWVVLHVNFNEGNNFLQGLEDLNEVILAEEAFKSFERLDPGKRLKFVVV